MDEAFERELAETAGKWDDLLGMVLRKIAARMERDDPVWSAKAYRTKWLDTLGIRFCLFLLCLIFA